MNKKLFMVAIGVFLILLLIFSYGLYTYNNLDYSQKYKYQLLKARELLEDEHSKEIFDRAVDVFECNQNFSKSKCENLNNKTEIFSHNVNFMSKIVPNSTIIEGGVVPDALALKTIHKVIGPKGKIIAFEPNINSIEPAKQNLKGCQNIEIYPYGLWKTNKTMKLWLNDEPRHSSVKKDWSYAFRGNNDDYIKADFIKIDSFVKEKNIERIDYIRLNIEGSELEALMGAKNTIKTFKPKMRIFIDYPEQLYSIILYLNSLNAGYKFYLDTNQHTSLTFCLYASSGD